MLYRRFRKTWENAKEGGAILADRRRFLVEVVGVEAGSYAARMGVNATFMYAFHIPVSVENVFLIVAATSISSTVALFPGAVGAQTALANVVLRDVASADAISAYSVGQSLIVTAWSVAFGLVLLSSEIGWQETRKLLHRKASDNDAEAATVESEATEPAAQTDK
jgi:hypothetical protein